LQEAADRTGIRLTVDDEFGHLDCDSASPFQLSSRGVHVRPLPSRVTLFRLTPGGQCSRGSDVLRQVTSATPCWEPGAVHAGKFLEMISGHTEAVAAVR
jgi:hypothetical protein